MATAKHLGRFRVTHIGSISELRAAAPAWDDLWWRSEVTMPTARAELVAQWVEQFAPRRRFQALIVEADGKWIAALPLVDAGACRVLGARGIPANAWAPGAGLLWDADAGNDAALGLLVDAVRGIPCQLLWLDEVPLEAPRWMAFCRALDRGGIRYNVHERYRVGWIETGNDWDAFRTRWSRNFRQGIGRKLRRLAEEAEIRFEFCSQFGPGQVATRLHQGFEVEDLSWKGKAGSSVLRRGMFNYFLRQAEQLAAWDQLTMAFLRVAGGPIAFCYGLSAKGVFHYLKVGYDPTFARFSPGQLLLYHLLQRLCTDPEYRAFDSLGEMNPAYVPWKPVSYAVGQLVVAPHGAFGRTVQYAHAHWWPPIRRLKARLFREATRRGDRP